MNGLIKKATQRKIMYLGLILLGVLLLLFVAPVPQAYAFDGNPTSQFSPSLEKILPAVLICQTAETKPTHRAMVAESS